MPLCFLPTGCCLLVRSCRLWRRLLLELLLPAGSLRRMLLQRVVLLVILLPWELSLLRCWLLPVLFPSLQLRRRSVFLELLRWVERAGQLLRFPWLLPCSFCALSAPCCDLRLIRQLALQAAAVHAGCTARALGQHGGVGTSGGGGGGGGGAVQWRPTDEIGI